MWRRKARQMSAIDEAEKTLICIYISIAFLAVVLVMIFLAAWILP